MNFWFNHIYLSVLFRVQENVPDRKQLSICKWNWDASASHNPGLWKLVRSWKTVHDSHVKATFIGDHTQKPLRMATAEPFRVMLNSRSRSKLTSAPAWIQAVALESSLVSWFLTSTFLSDLYLFYYIVHSKTFGFPPFFPSAKCLLFRELAWRYLLTWDEKARTESIHVKNMILEGK